MHIVTDPYYRIGKSRFKGYTHIEYAYGIPIAANIQPCMAVAYSDKQCSDDLMINLVTHTVRRIESYIPLHSYHDDHVNLFSKKYTIKHDPTILELIEIAKVRYGSLLNDLVAPATFA